MIFCGLTPHELNASKVWSGSFLYLAWISNLRYFFTRREFNFYLNFLILILDYFCLLSTSTSKLGIEDLFCFFFLFCFFYKLVYISYEYRLFFFFLMFFFLIFFIGWMGFTLNFLILLVLYSTLVVVFWIFSATFEDTSMKRESSVSLSGLFLTVFLFVILSSVLPTTVKPSSSAFTGMQTPLDFFDSHGSLSEFSIIFLSLFFYHPVVVALFFVALIIVCMTIIGMLFLKYKADLSESSLSSIANTSGKSTAVSLTGIKTVFWSSVNKTSPTIVSFN